MHFAAGADVLTPEGEKAGEVSRVVIDPRTREVTHLVVHKGLLFTEDKLVPVDLVSSADEDRVVLREHTGDTEELMEFKEEVFLPLSEAEAERVEMGSMSPQALYPYPFHVSAAVGVGAYPHPTLAVEVKRNIPEGAIALHEGAPVVDVYGEPIGKVVDVITGHQADRLSHIVVSEGLLRKSKRLVPAQWIDKITDERVRLAVGAEYLASSLPEYHE